MNYGLKFDNEGKIEYVQFDAGTAEEKEEVMRYLKEKYEFTYK